MKNNKKHTIILFFLSISYLCSYGQRLPSLTTEQKAQRRQQWEQRGDSAIASREVIRMKHLFVLTPQQEQKLFQGGISINQRRREVIKTYGKTDALQANMAKVKQSADSLYRSVVGEKNYQLYKDALHSNLQQRQSKNGIDSLHAKTQQP